MTDHHHSRAPRAEHVPLDIGGDVGALVVHTDRRLHGKEVEISAAGRDAERAHKQVHERRVDGVPFYAAVFERLEEGAYTLWLDGIARARDVQVAGAAVTELDWRPGARADRR